jgi:asparagine synthase (glutamine-hydrolysing)
MSGFCGVWHRDGRPVDPAELTGMSDAIRHRGRDGEHRWISDSAGFAFHALHVTPEAAGVDQPFVDAGAVILFDGRLDNRDELLGQLHGAVARDAADCEYVAAAYQTFGADVFARLLGDFAIAIFDPARRRLLLARDRMGTRPRYYCVTGETVLLASEIKAIVAHPAAPLRPNDDALADYLMPGDAYCGDLTFFDGVYRVLPGKIFEASPDWARQRPFWDFDLGGQIRYSSLEEYAGQLRELMVRAVQRRARCAYPIAVSVSGGLDSSGVFCLLSDYSSGQPLLGLHEQFEQFEESSEESYVRELERATHTAIQRMPAESGFMVDVDTSIWHTEVPVAISQGNSVRKQCALASQNGARAFLHGQFGDHVIAPMGYLIDLFVKLRWGALRRSVRTMQAWMQEVDPGYFYPVLGTMFLRALTPGLLMPAARALRHRNSRRHPAWFTRALRERAMRRAARQASLPGRFASYHAESLYRHTVWPRFFHSHEAANKTLAQFGMDDGAPFLDRDLVAFLMAIPGNIVNLNGVPKGLYREAMRGILPEKIRLRRDKADFARFNNSEAAQELRAVRARLHGECLGVQMGYFDRVVLQQAIAQAEAACSDRFSAEPARRLTALIGLELWLGTFFGRPRSQITQPPAAQPLAEFSHAG